MAVKKIILFPLRIFFFRIFHPVYKKRLAEHVASLCEDNSRILDFGCDDGTTAKMIMALNPSLKIVGIDTQSDRPSKIPRKIYNGKKIPYRDDSFDIVMVLDVLHHTEDALPLLEEMKRVSRKHVIIKDQTYYGFFSKYLVYFADYISNLPYGIKCTFNFLSSPAWKSCFSKLDLKLIQRPKNLNYGFGINEKYNPIFKLEKIN